MSKEGLPTALAHGQWLGDTALLRRDGSQVPVSQLILAPPNAVTSQVEFTATICRDLTQRQRDEAARCQLQQEQELILDNVPALIWYKDTANHILRVNARVACSLGLSKAQIEGRHCAELYPQDAERYYRDDCIVVESGVPRLGIEEPQRLPSGEQHWLRTDKVPLMDASGRVTGILVMALDITAQKKVEETLRFARNDLARAQAMAKVGSWRLDLRDNRLTWSAQAYRLFGIPPQTPLTYETFLSAVHPEDRAAVERNWQAALHGAPYDIEHRIVVDGQVKWVRELVELERDERGEVLGGFGTVQDITERKASDAALHEADRLKDEFLATLAHELRNPLAPLRNGLEILRLAGQDPAASGQALTMMGRQIDQLVRLVDDLLDLNRITQGRIVLRRERVALTALLRQVVQTVQPLAQSRRHRLELVLPDALLLVDADPLRLAQIFANLLSNAVKYTDPGGHIRVGVERDGGAVVVTIADNGVGIPAALLPRIFDMFVQDPSLEQGHDGLGIGLHIVQRLVAMHDGHVEAHSAGRGQGSTFRVHLPLTQPAMSSAERAVADTRCDPVAKPWRILVVDDNHDVADSLALLLRLLNHEVRIAYDGPMALALAADFCPQIVLLDLGMPTLDGYATAERLRAQPRGREMRLVALSGWGQEEVYHRTRAAGFDHHLVKPVDSQRLAELLAGL